jgi:hypothetical protein
MPLRYCSMKQQWGSTLQHFVKNMKLRKSFGNAEILRNFVVKYFQDLLLIFFPAVFTVIISPSPRLQVTSGL